jgi:carbon monoxide dehydrogenase subunit G
MNLEHEFTVPVPIDVAWKVLLDVERVAPCMPGAALTSVDGDSFTGTVKVKVGPIQVTYKGQAKFVSKDDDAHRAVIEASGKEARGSGTAGATVTTQLVSDGTSTKVQVQTDLNVTGRPAQFGRGVMSEVAAKLIDQFAKCLEDEINTPSAPATPPSSSGDTAVITIPDATAAPAEPVQTSTGPAVAPTPGAMTEAAPAPAAPVPPSAAPSQPRRAAEPIDLLDVAGGSLAKRLAPVAAALLLLLLIVRRRRRS